MINSARYIPPIGSWEHDYLSYAKSKMAKAFTDEPSTVNRRDISSDDLASIFSYGDFPSPREEIFQTGKATCQIYLTDYDGVVPNGIITNQNVHLPESISPWHTNHWFPGKRSYWVWNKSEGSFFRYRHPVTGEIITDYESVGWTHRSFSFPNEQHDISKMLWHCVYAADIRVVLGVKVED